MGSSSEGMSNLTGTLGSVISGFSATMGVEVMRKGDADVTTGNAGSVGGATGVEILMTED